LVTAQIFLALYGLYLYGPWSTWSFQGLGDLIIVPSAHPPTYAQSVAFFGAM